ncbi:hypothetical protein MARPU_07820 [Marichromatium purpuratum 984]|uniref:Uncharacterized protein n=1 Tax=Marichromatium purpuratum 984 TaxID=765910 RepID=W0DYV2_MARPU|nr:hypothetical protein [Marichromatium purpuratum]AHF03780.1 hypothetical protein MARPU_07820 [Marichromatium purpuratum 984]
MHSGHLIVETHPDHPGLVRLQACDQPPPVTSQLRCAIRFEDVDTARMHAHQRLRRRLVDVDAGLYRVDPITACAAIAAIALPHRRVMIDPAVESDPELATLIARYRAHNRRVDLVFNTIGAFALLLLLALGILSGP